MSTNALSRLRQGYGEPGDNAFHQFIVTRRGGGVGRGLGGGLGLLGVGVGQGTGK